MRFGRKRKLTPQQIAHARKLVEDGQRREDVAALLNVNRTILYRALEGSHRNTPSAAPRPLAKIGNHRFRATGITAYLKNGGRLEIAQQMANRESSRTTRLYDRRGEEITLDEVDAWVFEEWYRGQFPG